jgi:CubicO group peptidase (beta-lactamase class C family)
MCLRNNRFRRCLRLSSWTYPLLFAIFCSPASADERGDKVDELLSSWNQRTSPGCQVGVTRNGQVVHLRAYGMASLEYGIPLTTRTPTYLASVSKQFTAAAVALLAEEGKLDLDGSIRKHVPDLPLYTEPVTIRHLIHHTSGLRDYAELMTVAGLLAKPGFNISETEVLDLVRRQKQLNFAPGVEHQYSNSNYVLLAILTKRVTGKSLREYAEERLFLPSDMRQTRFPDDRGELLPGRAMGHTPKRDRRGFRLDTDTLNAVGDGGVFSTVEDMLAWNRGLAGGKVGGPSFAGKLLVRGRTNDGKELDYAFGLAHGKYRGLRTIGHPGSWNGHTTNFLSFPDQALDIVCLCNTNGIDVYGLVRKIADIYLAEQLTEPAPALRRTPPSRMKVSIPEKDLIAYEGEYHNEEIPSVWSLSVENGGLSVKRPASVYTAERVTQDRFRLWFGEFEFRRDAGGKPIGFILHSDKARGLYFERKR